MSAATSETAVHAPDRGKGKRRALKQPQAYAQCSKSHQPTAHLLAVLSTEDFADRVNRRRSRLSSFRQSIDLTELINKSQQHMHLAQLAAVEDQPMTAPAVLEMNEDDLPVAALMDEQKSVQPPIADAASPVRATVTGSCIHTTRCPHLQVL